MKKFRAIGLALIAVAGMILSYAGHVGASSWFSSIAWLVAFFVIPITACAIYYFWNKG